MTYIGIEDWRLIILFVASLFVGILGGCVGMALGVIRVPLMTLLGIDPLLAAGSNLMVSLMGSTAGSWPAFRQKRIIWTVVLIIGIPSIIGSFLGAFYANLFSQGYLLFLIGIILLLSSVSMIFAAIKSISSKKHYQEISRDKEFQSKGFVRIREGFLGFIIGVLGGAIGVVLGPLRMLALVNFLKMSPRLAVGTNLVLTIFVSLAGFVGHFLNGNYDPGLIMLIGFTTMIGMYIGSRVSGSIDTVKLKLIIGLVLLLVSPFVFYDAIRTI